MTLPTTAGVSRPDAYGYGARLDELLLRLAVTPETVLESVSGATESGIAQLFKTETSPEDFTTDGGRRFTLSDTSGGEGLFYLHRPDQERVDRARYWDSRGIDNRPFTRGERTGSMLLHQTVGVYTDAPATPYLVVLPSGDVLYAAGNGVYKVTTISGTPARALEDPHAGTQNVLGLAVLGDEVYAALGSDTMAKRSSAGTWGALASAVHTTGVWAAKRRILATTTTAGNVLAEINLTTGAPTTLLTLPTNKTVTSVADVGVAILVASDDGYIYAYTETSGALTLSGQSQMPGEEWATLVAASLGVVLIGTAERTASGSQIGRLYRAQVATQAANSVTVVDLAMLRELPVGDSSAVFAPTVATSRRDAIYIGVRGDGVAQVWRYQLATTGLNRDLEFPIEGQFYGMGVVHERLVVGIGGDGIRLEDNHRLTYGYLISAMADHYSAQHKTWTELTVDATMGDSGGRAFLSVTTDPEAMYDPAHPSWVRVGALYIDSEALHLPMPQMTGRYLALKVELEVTDGATDSPMVSAVTPICFFDSDEITVTLPIDVSDRVERRHRVPITVKGLGKALYKELVVREGGPAVLEIFRPPLVLNGVVQRIRHRTPGIGERSAGALIAELVFKGRRNVDRETSAASSPGLVGLGLVGIRTVGI